MNESIISNTEQLIQQMNEFIKKKFNPEVYIYSSQYVLTALKSNDIKIIKQAYDKSKESVYIFANYLEYKEQIFIQLQQLIGEIKKKSAQQYRYSSRQNYIMITNEQCQDYILEIVKLCQHLLQFNTIITQVGPSTRISNFKRFGKILEMKGEPDKEECSPQVKQLKEDIESQYEYLGPYASFEIMWKNTEWDEQSFIIMIELSYLFAMKYKLYSEGQIMLTLANGYIWIHKHKSILNKQIQGLELKDLISFLKKHNFVDMLRYFAVDKTEDKSQLRQKEVKILQ